MRAKDYEVLLRAIEEGSSYGVNRAYKHNESPDRETIIDHVSKAVLQYIEEVFCFYPRGD